MGTKTTKPSNINVASKTSGIIIKSGNPGFKYEFKEADVPIEMPSKHAEKILRNGNFYIHTKSPKKAKSSESREDNVHNAKETKEEEIH